MQAQGFVELGHDVRRGTAEDSTDPLDGDRADLLGLRLGVVKQLPGV